MQNDAIVESRKERFDEAILYGDFEVARAVIDSLKRDNLPYETLETQLNIEMASEESWDKPEDYDEPFAVFA